MAFFYKKIIIIKFDEEPDGFNNYFIDPESIVKRRIFLKSHRIILI